MTTTDEHVATPDVQDEPDPRVSFGTHLRRVANFEVTPRRVPLKELQQFSRELAVFVKSGIPITEALELIKTETASKHFAKVLDEILESIHSGSTFAEAAARHSDAFPKYYLGILQAAEVTGNLDMVLVQLSEYIERDLDARRKVIGALIYPAVIAVLAIGVVGVLVGYVLPRFDKFFKSLDAKLPVQTRILISIGHGFHTYWYVVVGVIVLLFLTGVWLLSSKSGRRVRDHVVLKLPYLGALMRLAILERFCRTLSSMVTAGVPLPTALSVASEATSNDVYERGIEGAREQMMRGEGLATPLANTGLFPAAARQMLRVGESTGSLDDQLHTTAEYFERELDYKLKKFTALFEPAVILVMGAVVAFVAIALISAMYGIFHQVHVNQ